MNLQEIKKIMELFDNSDIAKFSIKQEGFELKLQKAGACAQSVALAPQVLHSAPQVSQSLPVAEASASKMETGGDFITSPMVGTFYKCPSPGAAPYANVGDTIKKGQTIGIIEAMKIMNEIEAEFDCKILSFETNDATPVEYGTSLVKVQKL